MPKCANCSAHQGAVSGGNYDTADRRTTDRYPSAPSNAIILGYDWAISRCIRLDRQAKKNLAQPDRDHPFEFACSKLSPAIGQEPTASMLTLNTSTASVGMSSNQEKAVMIKFTGIMRRLPSLTHVEFVDHHRNVHGPLFKALPAARQHVRRYVQSHPIPGEFPGFPSSDIDGITDIWFDDLAGFEAVFTDAEYMRIVRPDELSFIDMNRTEVRIMSENIVME